MPEDDKAAQKARAESLHREIDKLKKGRGPAGASQDEATPPPAGESPAEFVHRKMRELDKKK
jgi:hypothetical protein